MNEKYTEIIEVLGKDRVLTNEPLSKHTTFRIGGPADLFYKAKTEEDLITAIKIARKTQTPYFVLGEGSKLLIGDKGFRGIIIKAQSLKFPGLTGKIQIDNTKIKVVVGSGVKVSLFLKELAKASVSGLEFMTGIPGTIGGAVRGNAGAWQQQIGDKVNRVKILDRQNEPEWIDQKDCAFSYRDSRFKQNNDEIILQAELVLEMKDKSGIKERMDEITEKRKLQPKGCSAGCVFVNPKPQVAGALIEQCGLKGFQVGGARISNDHANFIINTGEAKASDVVALINLTKKKVKEKFGVNLKEEIVRIGEF